MADMLLPKRQLCGESLKKQGHIISKSCRNVKVTIFLNVNLVQKVVLLKSFKQMYMRHFTTLTIHL